MAAGAFSLPQQLGSALENSQRRQAGWLPNPTEHQRRTGDRSQAANAFGLRGS